MIDRKTEQLYWSTRMLYHKPPVDHKIVYFDPSAAPMITSRDYNNVVQYQKDKTRVKRYKQISMSKIN